MYKGRGRPPGGRQSTLSELLAKTSMQTPSADTPDDATPAKRGRGRPKGSGKQPSMSPQTSTLDTHPASPVDADEAPATTEPPKKRGRPPKTPSTPDKPHDALPAVPKKRGRPPKSPDASSPFVLVESMNGSAIRTVRSTQRVASPEPEEATAPKKRGRPPKSPVASGSADTQGSEGAAVPAILDASAPKKRGRPPKARSPSVDAAKSASALSQGQPRESSVPATPKKRGRPPKSPAASTGPDPVQARAASSDQLDPATPKKRGRPPKNAASTSANTSERLGFASPQRQPDTLVPMDLASPKKRGRPPKLQIAPASADATQSAASSISPEASTPRKRGRPPKNPTPSTATSPLARATVSPRPEARDLAVPKKRGRPRKDSTAPVLTSAEQQTADSEANTPKKRGRPRKYPSTDGTDTDAAADEATTPKKRGRPRKNSNADSGAVGESDAADEPDAEEEPYSADEPDASEQDEVVSPFLTGPKKLGRPKGGKNRPRQIDPATGKRILYKDLAKQARANNNEDEGPSDGDADAGDGTPKKPRKYRSVKNDGDGPAWFGKLSSRVADFWAGPINEQKLVNPTYIDVGLDERTWSALQSVRVDSAAMELESCEEEVAKYMSVKREGDGDGAVSATMVRGKALSDSDPVLRLQPFDVHALEEKRGGFIVNTGESITSVDWAPQLESQAPMTVDYVAAGSLGPGSVGSASMGVRLSKRIKEPVPGAVQIWRLATAGKERECWLDVALLHTFGRCLALKWCPISMDAGPNVGILAAIFGDGHLRVCVVPEPGTAWRSSKDSPAFVHWPRHSLVDIQAPHGIFTALNWASADVLVAGTSRGCLMAWEIGAAIQAQHAQVLSAGSEWPYGFSLDQIGSSDDSTQLIPMVNHRLHGEEIRSINVYCSGSVPELAFSANRNAKGFKAAALSDLQVLTLGIDGRFRQVMLQFPARVNTAIEFPSRRTPVGAAFWFYGTCVFSEADKGLRLQHEPLLSAPRDPWIRSAVEAGGHAPLLGAPVADDKQAWNQGLERPSLYAVKLEVPTLQLSVSDMHPYVAIAKSDGELVIANMCVYDLVRGSVPHSRSLYALFCAPDAGEESRFVYKRRAAIEARPRGNKRSSSLYNLSMPQVSVLACAWSRNPRTFAWIASASANGVLRIESAAP